MSDLSERYGQCAECGEYAVHLAFILYPEFTGDDDDLLEGVSVYANETPPVGDELLAHICFKCGHIEDVGDRQFCEREYVWTAEWPTEPGMYWFFGFDSRHALGAELRLIEVRRLAASGEIIVDFSFKIMEKHEPRGLWTPANLPESPLSQLEALL